MQYFFNYFLVKFNLRVCVFLCCLSGVVSDGIASGRNRVAVADDIFVQVQDSCIVPPLFLQKTINVGYDVSISKLARLNEKQYIALGHIYSTFQSSEAFLMGFDDKGNVSFAKRIGQDIPDEVSFSPYARMDSEEYFLDFFPVSDTTFILIGNDYSLNNNNSFERPIISLINNRGEVISTKSISFPPDKKIHLEQVYKTDQELLCIGSLFSPSLSSESSTISFLFRTDLELNAIIDSKTYIYGIHESTSENDFAIIFENFIDDESILGFSYASNIPYIGPTNLYTGFVYINFSNGWDAPECNRIISSNTESSITRSDFGFKNAEDKLFIPFYKFGNQDYSTGIIKITDSLSIDFAIEYSDTISDGALNISDISIKNDSTTLVSFGRRNNEQSGALYGIGLMDSRNGHIENFISKKQIEVTHSGSKILQYKAGNISTGNYISTNPISIYFNRAETFPTPADLCNAQTVPVTTTPIDISVIPIPLNIDSIELEIIDHFLPVKALYPTVKDECCADLPDAFVQYVQPAYPCGDSIGMAVSICNTGYAALDAGYPVSLYGQNPESTQGNLLNGFETDVAIPGDSCIMTTINISDAADSVFVVLGDAGGNTPFDIYCDFPLHPTVECDYFGNVKGTAIPAAIGVTAFEDDYFIVCPKPSNAIDLIAPPYLQNPVWNDTLHNDTMTTHFLGWHYLTATTPCGDLFTDSVEVTSESPNVFLNIPFHSAICLGDTLFLDALPPHDTVRFRIAGSPFNHDSSCGDYPYLCPTDTVVFLETGQYLISVNVEGNNNCLVGESYFVTVEAPVGVTLDTVVCPGPATLQNTTYDFTADTTLTFHYPYTASCDSTITYQVQVNDTTFALLQPEVCEGDSYVFDNIVIAAGESQLFAYLNQDGCDSTILVETQLLPTITNGLAQTVCQGDSILIFEQWASTPGDYRMTYSAANNCDSVVTVSLEVLDFYFTENVVTACSGTPVSIHGNPETAAGVYEAVFTAANGCDSISSVELVLFENVLLEATIDGSCADEAVGNISTNIISGQPPFTFQWSDGSTDSLLTTRPPGRYALTLTDANGCAAQYAFDIPETVDCPARWFAPNAFSPNDDGINDRFVFYGNHRMRQIVSLEIFDRRGSKVFGGYGLAFNDESAGWDGRLKGRTMNPQVLVWVAEVEYADGRREKVQGDVTLLGY